MNRLTPERKKYIETRQFFGVAKRVIMELLYEIEQLNLDLLHLDDGDDEDYEDDDDVYQKFQDTDHDQLRSVLKTEVKTDAAKKFFTRMDKK